MSDESYSPEEIMSAEEREQRYNEKIRRLVQFAYENAPAVKDRLDRAGVKPSQIRTTKDLELIPFITRDEMIELQASNPPFGGLLAMPVKDLYRILFSPGPIYVPLASPECARDVLTILRAAGMQKGDRVICSLPYLLAAGAMLGDALALAGMVAIPAGAGNTELQLNMIRDLGIKGYLGTPSFLMNLVRKADELGYDFRREFKLRSGVMAAEPLLPEVRNTLEQDYGISLRDGIGMRGSLCVGCECGQRAGFHITEEHFIEIVDPGTGKQLEPGEVGAVVITGLIEKAFPVLRYMTGDISSLAIEPCPCGRTSPRMMGVMGRLGESLKVRALYLTPGQVEAVVSKFPLIARCQVVVGRVGYKDEMTFNLELADETIDRDNLSTELQASFQDACRLRIDRIKFVPRGTIPEEHKTIVDERSWQVKGQL